MIDPNTLVETIGELELGDGVTLRDTATDSVMRSILYLVANYGQSVARECENRASMVATELKYAQWIGDA